MFGKTSINMTERIVIKEVKSKKQLNKFIDFPYSIYRNYPAWVPPLKYLVRQILNFEKHPFWQHAKGKLFLAEKNGEILGRISAQINYLYNSVHKTDTGFFGFFECVNDSTVANALFSKAESWLKENGATIIQGPASPSINDKTGFLANGFDRSPSFMMPYNPEYYLTLSKNYGFKKAKTLFAYEITASTPTPKEAYKVAARLKKRRGIHIRRITKKSLHSDIHVIKNLFNKCWEKNWGFTPITQNEAEDIAAAVKLFGSEETSLLAFYKDKPVGIYIAMPDINQIVKKMNGKLNVFSVLLFLFRKFFINRSRTFLIGIDEKFRNTGLVSLLYCEADKYLRKRYKNFELGWVLDDNTPAIKMMNFLNGKICAEYHIMQKDIL